MAGILFCETRGGGMWREEIIGDINNRVIRSYTNRLFGFMFSLIFNK